MATSITNPTVTQIQDTDELVGKNHPTKSDTVNVAPDELLQNDTDLHGGIDTSLDEVEGAREDLNGKDKATPSIAEAVAYMIRQRWHNSRLSGGLLSISGGDVKVSAGVWRIKGKLQITTSETTVGSAGSSRDLIWVKAIQGAGDTPTFGTLSSGEPDKDPVMGPWDTLADPVAHATNGVFFGAYVGADSFVTTFTPLGDFLSDWITVEPGREYEVLHNLGYNPLLEGVSSGFSGLFSLVRLWTIENRDGEGRPRELVNAYNAGFDKPVGTWVRAIRSRSLRIITGIEGVDLERDPDTVEWEQPYRVRSSAQIQVEIRRPLHVY